MHLAAALILGHLHVRRPDLALELALGHAGQSRERAWDVDRRVAPEGAERCCSRSPRPRSRSTPGTVAPRGTGRRPRVSPGSSVGRPCEQTGASRRARQGSDRPFAPSGCVCTGAEARRGQCEEHRRMVRHRIGHALPTSQTGGDQVVGVIAVALRARRADRLATIPARLPEHTIRLDDVSTRHAGGRRDRSSRSCPRNRTGRAQYPDERSCASNAAKSGRAARAMIPSSSSGLSAGAVAAGAVMVRRRRGPSGARSSAPRRPRRRPPAASGRAR